MRILNSLLKDLSKTDKRILIFSILMVLSCILFLTPLGDDLFYEVFFGDVPSIQIGQINSIQNDARHKRTSQNVWITAKAKRAVRSGESIFAGEKSSLLIDLLSKAQVFVGSRSLMRFENLDAEPMANLILGTFRLKANGTVQLGLVDEVVRFEGNHFEIEIVIDRNKKIILKLLNGQASIKTKKMNLAEALILNKAFTLSQLQRMIASMPQPPIRSQPVNFHALEKPQAQLIPGPLATNEIIYIWKFRDLYDVKENTILEKGPHSDKVNFEFEPKLNLNPPTAEIPNRSVVQRSSNKEFKNAELIEFSGTKLLFNESFIGDNYWRVQYGSNRWSEIQSYKLSPRFLTEATPQAVVTTHQVSLKGKNAKLALKINTTEQNPMGFLMQKSTLKNFTTESTSKIFFLSRNRINLLFSKPGKYYYRFQTITARKELSEWSNSIEVRTHLPKKVHSSNRLAKTSQNQSNEEKSFEKLSQKVQIKKREVASTNSSIISKPPPLPEPLIRNEKYKSTQISLNSFLWTMFSSEQYYSGEASPITAGLGTQGYWWFGSQGLEGSIKSGIAGMNKSGQSQTSLKDLEVRYHYRIFLNSPWRMIREFQISAFAGFENYRSSGSSFVNQYDLLKLGTTFYFPLSSNWSSGGEFVYGVSSDKSQKREISGQLNYFLNPNLSLGVGYRSHLFDAGSVGSSPRNELPYREGNAEGYSALKYHY